MKNVKLTEKNGLWFVTCNTGKVLLNHIWCADHFEPKAYEEVQELATLHGILLTKPDDGLGDVETKTVMKNEEELKDLIDSCARPNNMARVLDKSRVSSIKNRLENSGIGLIPEEPGWSFILTPIRTIDVDRLVEGHPTTLRSILEEMDDNFIGQMVLMGVSDVKDYRTHINKRKDVVELFLSCFYKQKSDALKELDAMVEEERQKGLVSHHMTAALPNAETAGPSVKRGSAGYLVEQKGGKL